MKGEFEASRAEAEMRASTKLSAPLLLSGQQTPIFHQSVPPPTNK